MYGYRLRNFAWQIIALVAVTYLTFFGPEPSWSQNAGKAFGVILNLSLIAIAKTFSGMANGHMEKEREIYKWFSKPIRLEHLARFTEYSFWAILVFQLNSGIVPEWMHMVATGLGVTGLFLTIAGWFDTKTKNWWIFIIPLCVAVLMLVSAFTFKWLIPWNVGHGEFALAVIGLAFQFKIKN